MTLKQKSVQYLRVEGGGSGGCSPGGSARVAVDSGPATEPEQQHQSASTECRLPAQLAQSPPPWAHRPTTQIWVGAWFCEVGLFSGVVTSWLFAVMMVVVEVGWAGSPSPAFEQQLWAALVSREVGAAGPRWETHFLSFPSKLHSGIGKPDFTLEIPTTKTCNGC